MIPCLGSLCCLFLWLIVGWNNVGGLARQNGIYYRVILWLDNAKATLHDSPWRTAASTFHDIVAGIYTYKRKMLLQIALDQESVQTQHRGITGIWFVERTAFWAAPIGLSSHFK